MATLKLSYRTSKNDVKTVNLRARYSVGGGQLLYAVLETNINIDYWDDTAQKLRLENKPKDFRNLSIEEQNKIIDNINAINVDIKETNFIIGNLCDYITNAFNNHVGSFESKWLQNTVDEFYNKLKPQATQITYTLNSFILSYINDLETGKRLKKKKDVKVSEGTIKSIKGFRSQFSNYQEAKKRVLDFEDITMDFYNDFKSYLLFDKSYSINTIGRMIKILKTVMYAAKDMKLHNNREIENKDFSANYEDVDNVYLTEERIDVLYNMDLSKHTAWEKIRDVFIVGCLTGQRVSDYKRINSNMIVKLDNKLDYIELTQEKTEKTVYIPLDWRIKNILDKYEGTLPKVYDQKINDIIKKICEQAGFIELVDTTKRRAGLKATISKRFCDMVKTHTARRSLCTNMYKSGARLSYIMTISGHESEDQLKTYLKLNDKEKAMLADDGYFKRVKMTLKLGS